MKKLAIALLFLLPLSFAAWQTVAGLALLTSAAILGLIFAIGFGFGINEMQMMAKEEMYQLLALGVLMALLVGTDSMLNAISENEAFAGEHDTMQEAAIASMDETQDTLTTYFNDIVCIDNAVANEAAKGYNCNIMNVGYYISGCGGFSMLNPPMSMAGSIVGFAIGELAAIKKLIEISTAYGLTLLLPLGIVLRTLKMTRGAGGLLIGLGISMYIMLPMGILAIDMAGENFLSYEDGEREEIPGVDFTIDDDYHDVAGDIGCDFLDGLTNDDYVCDAGKSGSVYSSNEGAVVDLYRAMKSDIRKYLYMVLVKATLGPIIALMMFVMSLRFITSLSGAEVDVSGLAKVI